MRRLPPIATALVALAVSTMVALGVWQLHRDGEKRAEIALLAANLAKPAVAWSAVGPIPLKLHYRRSGLVCLRVVGWEARAGKDAAGNSGYRVIAQCATGAEGPGARVALGVAARPDVRPAFRGGPVVGWIVPSPGQGLVGWLTGAPSVEPILLAERPPAGLAANARPDPATAPNNHVLYAVQWFVFAGAALVIYALALRRRAR